MSFTPLKISSGDGYTLSLRVYDASAPKAVVKCIHGMEEHQRRYEDFAGFLQAAGYAVVTADLRGHGPDAPLLSHIADRNGAALLLQDEEAILAEIRRRYPGVPLILFGHSMGTIIARALLQKHSADFSKVVLSGYPNPTEAAGAGLVLANIISLFKGKKGHSALVDGMVLGAFSKAVPDAKSPLDWLSVNPENVRRYGEDPLCGAPFTLGSYLALFALLRQIGQPGLYQQVRKELPFLLISGADDPCTGGEKGREASAERLRRAGFTRLEEVILPGMRHEILNETGRQEVCQRILAFLDS